MEEGDHGFDEALLHKTAQRIPLRSSLDEKFNDLRKLEYQIRQESPSPDRHSTQNILKDFYAWELIGPDLKQRLTDHIPLTHRREHQQSVRSFLTDVVPSRSRSMMRQRIVDSERSRKVASDFSTARVPVTSRSISREASTRRLSEIDSVQLYCTRAKGDLSAERMKVKLMQGKFIFRLRNCSTKLKKLLESEAKGKVPQSLIDYKRKTAALRKRTPIKAKKLPTQKLEKQAVSEFRIGSFFKASQNHLPLNLRSIYTMGTTSAKHLP